MTLLHYLICITVWLSINLILKRNSGYILRIEINIVTISYCKFDEKLIKFIVFDIFFKKGPIIIFLTKKYGQLNST